MVSNTITKEQQIFHPQKSVCVCSTGRPRAHIHKYYAAIGGIVVVCLLAVSRKNIVSSLSQMLGEFILISAATNLFDTKRKITSSTVKELSLIILRSSNLGVCNSSIFLGRVNSMSLGLVLPLKSLLLWCSGSSLYRTV